MVVKIKHNLFVRRLLRFTHPHQEYDAYSLTVRDVLNVTYWFISVTIVFVEYRKNAKFMNGYSFLTEFHLETLLNSIGSPPYLQLLCRATVWPSRLECNAILNMWNKIIEWLLC